MTPEWVQMMARYNAWQNGWVLEACAGLDHDTLTKDRGAFFGSILGTLSHLLWGDTIWMSRFDGGPGVTVDGSQSAAAYPDFATYAPARRAMDQRITDWAEGLTPADIVGDIQWYSGFMKREFSRPKLLIFTHFFNHQTHHRGQVHALLTSVGIKTTDTDIPFMPETG